MDGANILQPDVFIFSFPLCPCCQLHAVGHTRSLSGSNGIARRLYPDLPFQVTLLFHQSTDLWANKHSLSCLLLWFSLQPCGWEGTAAPKGLWLYWDARLNRRNGLKHTVRHLAAHVQHPACGVVKGTIRMTSGVFKLGLLQTLLIPLSAEMHDSCMSVLLCCLPAMITPDQRLCYCVIQQRNGGNVAANVATGVTMVPHAERWPWALICMSTSCITWLEGHCKLCTCATAGLCPVEL